MDGVCPLSSELGCGVESCLFHIIVLVCRRFIILAANIDPQFALMNCF